MRIFPDPRIVPRTTPEQAMAGIEATVRAAAHAVDQRTSIEDLRKCTRIMATFIANWCGIRPRG